MKDIFAAASKIKSTKHITLDQVNDQFNTACIMTARISQIKLQKYFHKPAQRHKFSVISIPPKSSFYIFLIFMLMIVNAFCSCKHRSTEKT